MADQIIENPTYMEHIRHFFDDVDLEHMSRVGIDLSAYESLKARSTDVYFPEIRGTKSQNQGTQYLFLLPFPAGLLWHQIAPDQLVLCPPIFPLHNKVILDISLL